MSFVTRDLASVLPRAKIAAAIAREDIIAQVRDAAAWAGGPANRPMTASLNAGDATGSTRMAYAAEGDIDPYAGFEARIVPENITLLPKSAGRSNAPDAWNERIVAVKKGESAQTILRDQGASAEDIRSLTAVLGARGRDGGLREGQKLRIMFAPDGGRLRVVRVIVVGDSAVEAVVALSDTGKYVAVDVQSLSSGGTEVAEADEDDENDTSAVRLYQSIYETALRNQVPRPVIDDLVRIYSYDVDFQRRASPGDSFEVLYSGEEDNDARNTDVLFAALTVGGETKKFFRFQSPDDGVVDYYDETGKSAKKFLVRKPVGAGIMRSGFGFRRHPILGYSKMHTGVDWAAPYGTPIFASGNGTVDRVGWEGGYGKYVRVKHNNGYETAYGHMSAFARGIEPGKRIRQGQVIGFVGSTGLSTGAHVHYEIVVNGRFVDPMRIRLPRGRVLEGPMLAGFEKERERIEGIMSRKAGPDRAGDREIADRLIPRLPVVSWMRCRRGLRSARPRPRRLYSRERQVERPVAVIALGESEYALPERLLPDGGKLAGRHIRHDKDVPKRRHLTPPSTGNKSAVTSNRTVRPLASAHPRFYGMPKA